MSSTEPARGNGLLGREALGERRGDVVGALGGKPQRLQQDAGDDRAGRDAVHAHVVLAELHRHAPGELDDGGLGRAVDHRRRVAGAAGGHARVVDDAARALAHHDRGRVLHAEEHAAEVHRHRPLGGVQRDRLDAASRAGTAGVVEEAVEPPVTIDRGADQPPDVVLARDVGPDELGAGSERPGGRLALRLPASREDHGGALLDEQLGGALPHAARRSGDDRDLALEPAHAPLLASWSPARST